MDVSYCNNSSKDWIIHALPGGPRAAFPTKLKVPTSRCAMDMKLNLKVQVMVGICWNAKRLP